MSGILQTPDALLAHTDGETDARRMTDYLYMLLEELRYTLSNLGQQNFNDTAFSDMADTITAPVRAELSDAEGNISRITQDLYNISLTVQNENDASYLTMRVGNTEIRSQDIHLLGLVTVSDLMQQGRTVINGGNITTGTIDAIKFRTLLAGGNVGGEVEMYYTAIQNGNLAGGIRLDDQGAGTASENRYRMYVYTNRVGQTKFALKLHAAGDMSMESGGNVYIRGTDIHLNGSVYINGIPLTGGTV